MQSSFFILHIDFKFWKIELTAQINKTISGSTSNIFKLNDLPFGGSCSINPKNGTALETFFSIFCSNWNDSDGFIQRYEYYGLF